MAEVPRPGPATGMSVPFPDAQLDKVEGQWKLQLQEVELRLKHLRIQQSQIDNGKQEQGLCILMR